MSVHDSVDFFNPVALLAKAVLSTSLNLTLSSAKDITIDSDKHYQEVRDIVFIFLVISTLIINLHSYQLFLLFFPWVVIFNF